MIQQTPAIVFRTVDYGESSRIVTLFTRAQGKLAVMVHGAKKPKSRFSGLMEVGNLLEVVYYFKSSRSVQTLKEASYQEKTFNLRQDFEKMAVATSALELINQLLHEGETNTEMFDFTRQVLVWLNGTERSVRTLFPYLQVRLMDLMGIGLRLVQDPEPEARHGYVNLETGTVGSVAEGDHTYKLNIQQFHYVALALKARSSSLLEFELESAELKNLIYVLDVYFKYHLEGIKDRKSDAIFEQIL